MWLDLFAVVKTARYSISIEELTRIVDTYDLRVKALIGEMEEEASGEESGNLAISLNGAIREKTVQEQISGMDTTGPSVD